MFYPKSGSSGPQVARKAFERSNFQLFRRFAFRERTANACSAGRQTTKNDGLPHRSL
jgi:hypothetical protein